MNLCIPSLGTLIRLDKDWTFSLYFESRNSTLMAALLNGSGKLDRLPYRYYDDQTLTPGQKQVQSAWKDIFAGFTAAGYAVALPKKAEGPTEELYSSVKQQHPLPSIDAVIPAGTILAFDRYFIRKGKEAWDSVTFKIEKSPDPRLTRSKGVIRRFWCRLQDANRIECTLLG